MGFLKRTLSYVFVAAGALTGAYTYAEISNQPTASVPLALNVDKNAVEKSCDFGSVVRLDSFSKAIEMRKAGDVDSKAYSEYLITRTFHEAGLKQLAHRGWTQLARSESAPETLRVLAIRCLAILTREDPLRSIPKLSPQLLSQVPEAAFRVALQQIEKKSELIDTGVKSESADAHLLAGLNFVKLEKHEEAVKEFALFLAASHEIYLKPFEETARMMMARSQYALKNYKDSENTYKSISRESNLMVESLSEMAWASLRAEHYSAAVGAGISLQTGGLRKAFAPEGAMVMAMALTELCEYPDAMRAIQAMKKRYGALSEDLDHLKTANIYSAVLGFLKKKKTLPDAIGTEMLKVPFFLTAQSEINQGFKEEKIAQEKSRGLYVEYKKKAVQALSKLRSLRSQYERDSKINNEGLAELRADLNQYREMKRAAPIFNKIMKSQLKVIARDRADRGVEIEAKFHERLALMTERLSEIEDNMRLVEIETLSGASEDLVFRNAHPEVDRQISSIQESANVKKAAKREGAWAWGKVAMGKTEEQEVWEDELGTFEADLSNRCALNK